ncbi:MAG: NlpC/P60 family protein [Hyphomonas sp.]|uniref:C40 family peptidase n=1 Tax=Hyphomonas sp. TaxID=87 RepID=UPI0035278130
MPDFDDKRLTPPPGRGTPWQVLAASVAVREAPAADARLASEALHGEALDVHDAKDGFALVQCRRDRYIGWADVRGISEGITGRTHRVATLRTHAYAAPDLKSPPMMVLSLGALVRVTGQEGDWRHCDGAGWVNSRHLEVNYDPSGSLAPVMPDAVSVALKFLGTPYLWGGRTSLGLDCTGLTQQAFEAAGVLLPRDSDMQFAWCGAAIADWRAPGVLRRGDLVFWKGHVGVMTDPETLLHANAWHMAVAQEPLQDAITRIANYYAEPIGARRIDVSSERGQVPAWKASPAAA